MFPWKRARTPDAGQVQEAVRSEYKSTLEEQQPLLMEAVQDQLRVVNCISRQGEPEGSESAAEARDVLHEDLYDRLVAAAAEGDVETISDVLDRRVGRLLLSFHREVLYRPAVERGLGKHRIERSSEVWADEAEQDAFQGELFCSLREFATAGAWEYVMAAVTADFGESSPFVEQLQTVRDEEGLPSLLDAPPEEADGPGGSEEPGGPEESGEPE
jgi:hypothetical protein